MKKLFKKLALMVVALLTFSVGSNYTVKEVKAADETYSYSFDAKQFTAAGTKDLNGVNWTFAGTGGPYFGYDSQYGKGQQFGSSKAPYSAFTLTSDVFNNVEEIKINTSGASSINAKFTTFVGDTQVGSTTSLTSSAKEYTFTVDPKLTGAIKFSYTQSSSKAIYIKSISVTCSTDSGETELTDEDHVKLSLNAMKNKFVEFYSTQSTIELPALNEDYGTTYSYTLVGDSNVYVKNADSLSVNPTNALKEATLTITASINGVEDSLDVVINSASNAEVLPIEEAIKVANYFGSTYSPDKFYVEGNVVSFANETYGNPTISDDTGSLYVYGLYSEDGSTLYGSMETKPVVGDTVKLYGVLGTYNNAVQMKNGWMVEHTVNSTDKELIEMEKTTASLAFDYSLTYESQEVEAGISSDKIVFEDNSYSNGEAVTTASASNFEVVFDKGTNTSNTAKYYDTGKAVRLYGGNTATISSDSSITKVVFAFASGEGTNEITADVGTFSTDTWTGSSNEVVFTISGASGHRRIVSIEVTTESAGTQNVLTSSSFANISILFGASVKTSLFEDFTTVKAGVMFSAGSVLDTEKAFKKEAETLVETDGVYSIGAELEIFAENVIVTSGTKDRLSEFITAAVYFVVDGETVILEEKTVSVESMVNTYLTEYAAYDSVKEHKDALEALKAFIEAE